MTNVSIVAGCVGLYFRESRKQAGLLTAPRAKNQRYFDKERIMGELQANFVNVFKR